MTKEEFIAKKTASERKIRKELWIPPGIYFAVICAMALAVPVLIMAVAFTLFQPFTASSRMTLYGEILFCAGLLGVACYQAPRAIRKLARLHETFGMSCAVCHRNLLFDQNDTGKCPKCGARVFDA